LGSIDIPKEYTLDWLIRETEGVYSLPEIYERLTEVINHPRSSIEDITRVISTDQGLTARLLKLANSPLFGYFTKIDSIGKAATIIGTQQLQSMALAVSVMEVFVGVPENLISMKSFWQHSIACGITARALAVYRREANVERVFAAGILHDVGRLLICTSMPEVFARIISISRNENLLLQKVEEELLGYTHATVGGKLLEKWCIPASISEPVACHLSPDTARKFPLEAAFVHVADIICKSQNFGSNGEYFVQPLEPSAWTRLDISAASIPEIIRHVEPKLDETLSILGWRAS
jgi:HD-like signal output (HDOD) protein